MKLTINQINDVTNGAVYITEQNGGVEFHRFTAEAENLYKNTKDYGLLLAPAGIKLCFETDSKLVEIPEENEPSCITVAYGVNDYCCDKKITIQNNCHKFLYNLTKNYPNSQIFVISPIWKNNGVENHDFSDFTDMCMLIGKEVEGFKNVRHICAYDFVPHNPKYYADKAVVHPNADGFEFYFKALYNELRKYNVYNHI